MSSNAQMLGTPRGCPFSGQAQGAAATTPNVQTKASPLHSRLSEVQAGACADAVCDPIDDLLEVGGVVDEVEPMAVDR